jgi:hypothetical protein
MKSARTMHRERIAERLAQISWQAHAKPKPRAIHSVAPETDIQREIQRFSSLPRDVKIIFSPR